METEAEITPLQIAIDILFEQLHSRLPGWEWRWWSHYHGYTLTGDDNKADIHFKEEFDVFRVSFIAEKVHNSPDIATTKEFITAYIVVDIMRALAPHLETPPTVTPSVQVKSREEVLAEHSRWLCRHFHKRPGYRLFYIDDTPDGEITVFKFAEPNITNLHIAVYSAGVVRISDGRPTKDIIYWQGESMGLTPLLAEIDKHKGNLL